MTAADDVPDLPPVASVLVAGVLVVVWAIWRVQIHRRREARREAGDPPVRAARWLVALARAPWALGALAAVGLALALLLAWILAGR
jgi:hypothetical protein